MIERKITAVLNREAAGVRLPDDLLDRIKREGARPVRRSRLASWAKHRAVQAAAAALLVLPLAGFAAKEIWVAPANAPGAQSAQRPAREMSVADLAAAVDFTIKLPAYLPEGMTTFASVLAGDSTQADARLRVVEVAYLKDGVGSLSVTEWRGEKAAAFPPGDPFPSVLDTQPWNKTLKTEKVEVGGSEATLLSYLISGSNRNRVYWHQEGIDYAVDADANLPVAELLKVAGSLK